MSGQRHCPSAYSADCQRAEPSAALPSSVHAASFRPRYALRQTVFFVGFMGAGKTTLARRLARECGCASIDLDRYIERVIGCRISEYFAREGEGAFRALEAYTLSHLAQRDPAFIACGGGIVEGEQNCAILSSIGFTVYMKVSVEEATSRISNPANRPLLADWEVACERAALREPLYEAVADMVVNTAGHTPRSLSFKMRNRLLDVGVLAGVDG